MKRIMNGMSAYFGRVPDWLRRRKILAWLFFVAATAFFTVGMSRAKFDTAIEGWFEKDDPLIVAFDWFHNDFGSDDHLYIVYKPKDGDVFSAQSLTTLRDFHRELESRVRGLKPGDPSALRHVVKVNSLINAPVLRSTDGALVSRSLVGDDVPSDKARLEAIRSVARSQKTFPLFYFSKDDRYGGILVETDFGAIPLGADGKPAQAAEAGNVEIADLGLEDGHVEVSREERPKFKQTEMTDYIALMNDIKAIMYKPEYAKQFEYYAVGNTAAAENNLQMISEMGMLNAVALLIMMLLLWFFFRSLSAIVWPIVIVVLSVVWMVGITSWLGFPVTSFVMIAVMLTLAVGIADTVHVISAYLAARRGGDDHPTAMRHSFAHVGAACLLTTIVNIVAMVALSITPIVPIKVFSFMCVLGVGLPLFFSIYLLPLMLDLWAPKPQSGQLRNRYARSIAKLFPDFARRVSAALDHVVPTVEKRPYAFITAFVALFALCLYGASLTRVDTDPVASFPKDSPIRKSAEVVDAHMMGAQSMEIYLDFGQVNALHDPFVLREIEKLQTKIGSKYGDLVVQTTSLVETVKDSYMTLNDGRSDMYRIPDTRDAVSQTLFLFNQSNPEDRRKLATDNYDRSRISVRLYDRGSYEYTRTWSEIQSDIDETVATIRTKYPEAKVSITGMLPLLMQGADYLTRSELSSFGLALVLISVILLLLFGSVKAGAIALIPNLIPAILAYGMLGLTNTPLDVTTMMIAPIIIGIAVDDTVHFVMRYRYEVVQDGDIRRALRTTIQDTGLSIVFTTLILGLGFGVMAFATNAGPANLGFYGSMAILIGLLNDLFFLPALIIAFDLKFRGDTADVASHAQVGLPAGSADA